MIVLNKCEKIMSLNGPYICKMNIGRNIGEIIWWCKCVLKLKRNNNIDWSADNRRGVNLTS